MMSAANQYPDFSGLTFEKVWAAMIESRNRMDRIEQERERERKESLERFEQERERERKESLERLEQERERERQERKTSLDCLEDRLEKYVQDMASELRKSQGNLDAQLGRLGNRFGDVVEHLIRPGAAAKFNELGFHFDGESSNLKIKAPETGKLKTELDIVLENSESVIVIEVKVNPDNEDVAHLAEQLQYYREYRLRHNPNDTKKIFGSLAAAVFPKSIQEAAIKSGFYVIVQSGDTVQIDVPEGFVPKAF